MLPVNHNPRLFYRIDLQKFKNLDVDSKNVIESINSTWSDVEYLLYLFHMEFGRLNDNPEMSMSYSALIVLGDSFYIYLNIICGLIKSLGEKHKNIKRLWSLNEHKIGKRIRTIRNNIIIHRSGASYKKPIVSISNTDPTHLIEHSIMTEEKGHQEVITLRPLTDISHIKSLLENVERLLLNENN